MMTHQSILAFHLCLAALLWTPVGAGAKRPSLAPVETAQTGLVSVKASGNGLAAQPQKGNGSQTARASKDADVTVVREIDAAGLKKLLQRDVAANRPLLVNFWATWCEPCRDEFPDLVQIDAQYRSRGLEFVTVSLDDAADINTSVPQFLREMRAQMPAYLLNTAEPEAAIMTVDPAWGGGLPATFLFDARGNVVFKHIGRVKPAELRPAIQKVIGDK